MLQSGVVILEQYSFYFLFWRVKSDPSIKISALLIDCRDLIRMTSMLALETLKHIAFAVRLVQITAFWHVCEVYAGLICSRRQPAADALNSNLSFNVERCQSLTRREISLLFAFPRKSS